jgi:hypothetical protein
MLVSPSEPMSIFSQLSDFWEIEDIWTDQHTGEVYILQNKIVMLWNPPSGMPLYHTWQSMDFVLPKPTNLAAYQIDWRAPPDQELPEEYLGTPGGPGTPGGTISITGRQIYNVPDSARINDIITKDMSVDPNDDGGIYYGDNPVPDDGANERVGAVTNAPWLTMEVYADGILRFTTEIKTTQIARMPSGFKARRWQFKFSGNGTIKTAKFGSTGLELRNV